MRPGAMRSPSGWRWQPAAGRTRESAGLQRGTYRCTTGSVDALKDVNAPPLRSFGACGARGLAWVVVRTPIFDKSCKTLWICRQQPGRGKAAVDVEHVAGDEAGFLLIEQEYRG